MRREDPFRLHSYIEFVRTANPDVAPTGKARLWWDKANGLLKLSVSGGAYAEVANLGAGSLTAPKLLTAIAAGAIVNSQLGVPKVAVYQETVAFGQFTDGGAAIGTYDLQTTIPAGARVLYALVTGITGFTGDTSATLQIGDGTTVARYSTGTPSVFTTAAQGVDMGAPSGTAWHTAAKSPRLTITSAADFTAVVAGALTVTIYYLAPI